MVANLGLQSVPATSEIGLNADQTALKAWGSAILNGTSNDKLQRWFNTSSPCRWEGVQCGIVGGEKRITGINISEFGLTGIMPSGLGSLTGLVTLAVASNKFNGSIPADIGKCINLEVSPYSRNRSIYHLIFSVSIVNSFIETHLSRRSWPSWTLQNLS